MEKVINPSEYTPEIISCIAKLQYRMEMTNTAFTNNDIKVIENEGVIYILANPILGVEPIFDEVGQFKEMIPLYNITIQFDENWLQTETLCDSLRFMANVPRLRILRPDLCMRITPC